jgi:hypothetical protein
MTDIGSLVANLKLESAAFIRDLGKAAQAVSKNTSAMQRSLMGVQRGVNQAATALKAYIGIAAARQVFNLAKDAIDSAAAIKDQATALGIAANELQAYRIAADQAGVSSEELDRGIGLFVKNLGAARAGTGPLNAALKETNAELLNQLVNAESVSEALDIFINALGETAGAADKARIGAAGFGKGWQSAAKLAADGAVEAKQRFLDLGIVLTDNTIRAADDLQDTFALFGEAINKGFQTGLIEAMRGQIVATDEALKKANADAQTFGEKIGQGLTKLIETAEGLERLRASNSLGDFLDNLRNASGIRIEEGGLVDTVRDWLSTGWDRFSKFMEWWNGGPPPQISGFPTNGDFSTPKPSPGIETVWNPPDSNVVQQSTDAINLNREALEGWETTVTDALGRSLEFEDLQKEGVSLFADMQTPLEQYASSLERIKLLHEEGHISAETFARANQQLALGMAENWLGAAGAVSGALAGIFKENKAFAVADAVINTAAAVVSALKNPPGPPFSFVYAAAAAAAGAAQIATILSTEPGSGPKSAAFSSKGGSASASAGKAARESAPTSRPDQSINIVVQGESFGPEHWKQVVAGLNSVIADGTTLNVSQR